MRDDDIDDDFENYDTGRLEAEKKNRDLIDDLNTQRTNFCGIGTNKTKRRLNKFIKEDFIALFLRLALEIEDKNITAKNTYGKYRNKIYESKYKLIKSLYEVAIKNNLKCGIQQVDCFSSSHIIYFHTPITNLQISWHMSPDKNDTYIKYTEKWDEIKNSTLSKLETEIIQYLSGKDLLKDANSKNDNKKIQEQDSYRVTNFSGDRYAIINNENKIVDDAQGYGYKTIENAQKVIWYKFNGGKNKIERTKKNAKEIIRDNPDVAREIFDIFEINFKEISRGETNLSDIAKSIKENHGMDLSHSVISKIFDLMQNIVEEEREVVRINQEAIQIQKDWERFDIKILPFNNKFAIYNKRNEIFNDNNGQGYKKIKSAKNAFILAIIKSKKFIALKEDAELLIRNNTRISEYLDELYISGCITIGEKIKQKYGIDITEEQIKMLNILRTDIALEVKDKCNLLPYIIQEGPIYEN